MTNNPSVVYALTRAYNAERTIRRAIESVLNQTYPHIRYFLRDNGSTDNTYAICKEYADRDARITLVRNERNFIYETEQEIADYQAELGIRNGETLGDNDFFCVLDADDAYLPDFFERAVKFAQQESLDIVVGGTQTIEEKSGKSIGGVTRPFNWTVQGSEFSDLFPVYHWHMRQWWGKLYRSYILHGVQERVRRLLQKEIGLDNPELFAYGYDTLMVLSMFQRAEKVGFLSGVQHRWYRQEKSSSSTFSDNRIVSDRVLQKATSDFLMQKCGFISDRNRDFLLSVYFAATKDTLSLVSGIPMTDAQRLKVLYEIFSCEYMAELFQAHNEEIQSEMTGVAQKMIAWANDVSKRLRIAETSDLIATLLFLLFASDFHVCSRDNWKYLVSKMPELVTPLLEADFNQIMNRLRTWRKGHKTDTPGWTELELYCAEKLGTPNDQMFSLLADIRRKRPVSWEALRGEERVVRLARNYPILEPLSASLLLSFSAVTVRVMRGECDKALNAFLRANNIEIDDSDAEAYFQFAQFLAAAAERADVFIYFKKQWIAFLLDCGRTAEAAEELQTYLEIMPEDEELLALRVRLRQTEDS